MSSRSERTKNFFEKSTSKSNSESKNNNKFSDRFIIALAIHNMVGIRPYVREDFIRKYNNESIIDLKS